MAAKNMWGKISTVDLDVMPVTILNQQADQLERATNGLLVAEVIPNRNSDGEKIVLEMDVVAPMIGHYRHRICTVTHGIDPYPATILAPGFHGDKPLHCKTRVHFEAILEKVLQSESTKRVVSALLGHSKSFGALQF